MSAPTPDAIADARSFVFQKWTEFATQEKHHPDYPTPPRDLTNACVFAAEFAHLVFGGTLRGNWHHHWVEHPAAPNGLIDLTEGAGLDMDRWHGTHATCPAGPYTHDAKQWDRADSRSARASVADRVHRWYAEWKQR